MRSRRVVGWGAALAALAVVLYCLGAGWMLSSGVKEMVSVGGPFTHVTLQARDPLVLDYDGDPRKAFGWEFETVSIRSELGPLPAWVVPPEAGSSDTWMVYTHGIGGRRENGYRFLSVARPVGITTLLYAYRNDAGAPLAPGGYYTFGLQEWRDLQSAVQFARSRGARRIILAADSMGGAITGQFLRRAPEADAAIAAVLDAPALDMRAVLRFFLEQKKLPLTDAVTAVASALAPWRVGIDLDETNTLPEFAQRPRFLFDSHGSADGRVPMSVSDELARLRPDMTYLRTHAPHVESWSENPERYREVLQGFLEKVLGS